MRRSYVGIAGQDTKIARHLARILRLPSGSGVLVMSVVVGGPAGRAGIRDADVVVETDGVAIEHVDDLHRLLNEGHIGRGMRLLIVWDATRPVLHVTPRETPR